MTLGVLAAHASIAYLLFPLPGLRWSTQDAGSPLLDACACALAATVMPAFFLLSGFSSAAIYAKRGANEFLNHRTRRLLPTLVLAAVCILPITAYAWFLGWAAQGFMPLETLWRWGIPDELEQDLYGLGHLWFLQSLWIFCVGVWIVHHLLRRLPFRRTDRTQELSLRILESFGMPILFAIPGAIILAIEPRVAIGFRQSFLPQWLNLAYYAPCFAVGFWLQRCQNRDILTRWCEWRLLLASGLFAALWPRLHEHLSDGSVNDERWLLAGLFSVFAWLAATGTFGVCMKYLNRTLPSPVRYVSEASLWVYLLHVPVVGLLHVNLLSVALPVEIKFLIVFTVGLALPLAIFSVVKRSWIGRMLEPQPTRQTTVSRPREAVARTDLVSPLVSP
ncbi:MAG: acyltransferase family protein, partial [Planctomycetaceae bacterium]|nr:acyltransferase family protein [Planctomycetaceae bacterium]